MGLAKIEGGTNRQVTLLGIGVGCTEAEKWDILFTLAKGSERCEALD